MNKKVFLVAGAVVAFFAGAILIDYFPVIAVLIAFLELCIGGLLGFFWGKDKFEAVAILYEKQYTEFKGDYVELENKYKNLKKQKTVKRITETPTK